MAIRRSLKGASAAMLAALAAAPAWAWKPTKSVEFVMPSQRGSSSDRLFRKVAEVMEKNGDLPLGHTFTNKPERQGAEGYLYLKSMPGEDHVLMAASAQTFLNPALLGLPINHKEFTPIARLLMDDFILWVNAETPFVGLKDFIKAVKARPTKFQMGGSGTGREDQLVVSILQEATGALFTYVPFRGGNDIAKALVEKRIDANVNNPGEAVDFWKQGKVRPLAVLSPSRINYPQWKDIPTFKELGYDVEYKMMRAVFGPPKMPDEAQAYFVAALRRVAEHPDFRAYARHAGFSESWLAGKDFGVYLEMQDVLTKKLVEKMSDE